MARNRWGGGGGGLSVGGRNVGRKAERSLEGADLKSPGLNAEQRKSINWWGLTTIFLLVLF